MPLLWQACTGTACLSKELSCLLLWPWVLLIHILPSHRLTGLIHVAASCRASQMCTCCQAQGLSVTEGVPG